MTLLGALLLLWPALRNGFPLVFYDSVAHLSTAATFHAVPDRPPSYGLFLTLGEVFGSIWVPVALQALLTSLLLQRLLWAYGGARRWAFAATGMVLLLLSSNVAKYPSWLMPDVMLAWLFLGVLLTLASRRRSDQWIGALAIVLAVIAANFHLALGLGVALLLGLWALWMRRSLGPLRRRRVLRVVLLIGCGWPLASLINMAVGAGFSPTRGGSVFLAARLHEGGLLLTTLDERCSQRTWKLCEHRETLRTHLEDNADWYLWAHLQSPLHRVGAWSPGSQREHGEIVRQVLRDHPLAFLQTSLVRAWQQLWTMDSSAGLQPRIDHPGLERMSWFMTKRDRHAFMLSAQFQARPWRLRVLRLDEPLQHIVHFWLAAVLAVGFALRRRWAPARVLLGALLFILMGAVLIGLTGTVIGRYMARVTWLLPYCTILALLAGMPRWRRTS